MYNLNSQMLLEAIFLILRSNLNAYFVKTLFLYEKSIITNILKVLNYDVRNDFDCVYS